MATHPDDNYFASSPNSQPLGLNSRPKKRGRPKKLPSIGDISDNRDTNNVSKSNSLPQGIRELRAKHGGKVGNGEDGEGGCGADFPRSQRSLPTHVKHRIVELFACFHTHKQVAETILAEFNVTVAPHQLALYDPQRAACQLGAKLRAYYDAVRQRYIDDAKGVAISHQAHRLRRLEAISDAALASKDYGNAIKALEIAAKEMGGLLAGQMTVKHEGTIGHVHASIDDARAEVAMRLAAIAEKAKLLPSSPSVPAPEIDGVYDVVEEDSIIDDLSD